MPAFRCLSSPLTVKGGGYKQVSLRGYSPDIDYRMLQEWLTSRRPLIRYR